MKRRPKRDVTCSHIISDLADPVGGNRPGPKTTKIPIWAVTRSQVVGESVSQLNTEKPPLADKYTEQAPLTSSPEHGSAEHLASSPSAINSTVTTITASSHSTSTAKYDFTRIIDSSTQYGSITCYYSSISSRTHSAISAHGWRQIFRHMIFKLSRHTSIGTLISAPGN